MEQRDYILREIEKISTLILGMLGRLKAISSPKQFEQEREALFGEFKEVTGLSIDDILAADPGQVRDLLTDKRGFNLSNIDSLADLLYEFSYTLEADESSQCIQKAIMLLEWLAMEEKTFNLDRERRLADYRKEL
jgi:hypothetical protein